MPQVSANVSATKGTSVRRVMSGRVRAGRVMVAS